MVIKIANTFQAVPKGFKTDLASIPRILWPFFAPSDYDSIAPAILHDWHYCCVAHIARLKADELFYYGLRYHGMNIFPAYLYYLSVRAAGWVYYKQGTGLAQHISELDDSIYKIHLAEFGRNLTETVLIG